LSLTTVTTQVGQAEYLDVCAANGCNRANQVVGYWDFQPISSAAYWVFIGSTTQHPDNHRAQVPAQNAMHGVAVQYTAEYPNNPIIGLNDSGLIRGRKFDLNFD
jgi:hypothetical protein